MSIGLRYSPYQPAFKGREVKEPARQENLSALNLSDLDKIPGVDTVNTTITDMANEGKVKSRKALNIIMTIGLGVAAFFTGKRITKTILDSISTQTEYLDGTAKVIKNIFEVVSKPFKNINPEKGGNFERGIRTWLNDLPHKIKNYSRTGIHKDIALERYAKKIGAKDVNNLDAKDLERFEEIFCHSIAKNGLSKIIASTIGLVIGTETFIEVGADKNKNGIPDMFEQKTYKEIIEIAQPNFDEKVINKARELNKEDEED